MNCRMCMLVPSLILAVVATTVAVAAGGPDKKSGAPEMQLPPGWTAADMAACAAAGTPGTQHAELAKLAGTWSGKTTMWMAPGTEPMRSECTTTMTVIMDGKFLQCQTEGEMPGMGAFKGMGMYGYDNVSQKFQGMWIDNMGTGMMTGPGERSADGKTYTWQYGYTCPLTKKPSVMREVHTHSGENAMTLQIFSPDPKTGKEFKMVEIAYTRAKK